MVDDRGPRAPETFSTARLDAHRGGGADLEFVAAMFADPRVFATLGGPRTRSDVEAALVRWGRHWEVRGFGPWVLTDGATGDAVGWLLLHTTDTGGTENVELGWTIAADRWREGLATEAATEGLRIAFAEVGLDELVTFTLVDNVASRGVMEKVGFAYDREVEHANLPHVLYRVDRDSWEQRHG
jgi:ribosomal-protein-alanine N-acetyltransferase